MLNSGDVYYKDGGDISYTISYGLDFKTGDCYGEISDHVNSDSNNKEDGDSGSVNGDDVSVCADGKEYDEINDDNKVI